MLLDEFVRNGTVVFLRNTATGRYIFVSSTERRGDNMVESKADRSENRNGFLLKPATIAGCYQLFNPAYGEYIFCSSDDDGGDNIAETHGRVEDRNSFQFKLAGDPVDMNFKIFCPSYGKYLFDSSTVERGDNVVEFHSNEFDQRNVFHVEPKFQALSWFQELADKGAIVSLRNAATGKYIFISSSEAHDESLNFAGVLYSNFVTRKDGRIEAGNGSGDRVAESRMSIAQERCGFLLKSASRLGCFQLFNPSCGVYLYCSDDKERGDNVAETHPYEEDRNAFDFQVVGNVSDHCVKIYNPAYGKYLFDSSTTERGDNVVELHPKPDDPRNIFYVELKDRPVPWMQNNLSLLGERTLRQICMPGSHDAGMSSFGTHTTFATDDNTLTQCVDILGQLKLGARYFDVRPVIAGGEYLTGHYSSVDQLGGSWQGSNGQSVKSIIDDVNTFTENFKELVVLYLDGEKNTDVGNYSYRGFNQDEWNTLLQILAGGLNHLHVNADAAVDLTTLPFKSFIGSGEAAVVVVLPDSVELGAFDGKGFYRQKRFPVYNEYANSNNLDTMASDQLTKMAAQRQKEELSFFVLSWTLTQDGNQAVFGPSIRRLAETANANLQNKLLPACSSNCYPNVIFMDNISTYVDEIAMRVNRQVAQSPSAT